MSLINFWITKKADEGTTLADSGFSPLKSGLNNFFAGAETSPLKTVGNFFDGGMKNFMTGARTIGNLSRDVFNSVRGQGFGGFGNLGNIVNRYFGNFQTPEMSRRLGVVNNRLNNMQQGLVGIQSRNDLDNFDADTQLMKSFARSPLNRNRVLESFSDRIERAKQESLEGNDDFKEGLRNQFSDRLNRMFPAKEGELFEGMLGRGKNDVFEKILGLSPEERAETLRNLSGTSLANRDVLRSDLQKRVSDDVKRMFKSFGVGVDRIPYGNGAPISRWDRPMRLISPHP